MVYDVIYQTFKKTIFINTVVEDFFKRRGKLNCDSEVKWDMWRESNIVQSLMNMVKLV